MDLDELLESDDIKRMDRFIRKFMDNEVSHSQIDISKSAKSRKWFLDRIKNKINEKVGEPSLYKPEPFVNFGSYFKKTNVKDVDEYDVLVVIDSNNGHFSQKGEKIGDGLGSNDPNHKYDKKYKKSNGSGVSPNKQLNWLKNIVAEVVDGFGGTAPIRVGQAVTARIESQDINIDLVPAGIFQNVDDPEIIFYDIPKGDKDNGWILTNPKQDMKLIKDLAQDRDNFRKIIRLLKLIKNNYNFLISSFAIECCVVNYAQSRTWTNNAFIDFICLLNYLKENFNSKSILDSFDENNNLLKNVESTEWYAERLEKIMDNIKEQIAEEDDTKAYENIFNTLYNN